MRKLTARGTETLRVMLVAPALTIKHQAVARPAGVAWRQRRPAPRLVVAASGKQTVWNGEGPDYTMRDVERFHEDEAARKFHLPADMGQWDGEGKDYNMKDVQAFHEVQARAAANPDVFNGEGPGYGMKDVEAFHDAQAKARGPDASMYNGEGQDYDMKDVERFHEEATKDKMMRRK